MPNPTEELFEQAICDSLATSGDYVAVKNDLAQGAQRDFDPIRGLDTVELFSFIGATQIEAWNELIKRYGGDQPTAQAKFADRLASELDTRGAVDVLRHGAVDHGVTIKLAYFKPAHQLTDDLIRRYEANRLTVTRQLRYEPADGKTLDLALLVNGIVVATAELKNPLTGQGVEQAITQYRTDRDPKNRTLARAVVHFAVDPQLVAMTTRLLASIRGPARLIGAAAEVDLGKAGWACRGRWSAQRFHGGVPRVRAARVRTGSGGDGWW